jgi:hypothetical protein
MERDESEKQQTSEEMAFLVREILTRARPTLYLGSSPRWGWNDTDPVRQRLLSKLREIVPGMNLGHVPDWKPLDSLTFSSGISILAGLPASRLEAVLAHLDAERSHEGFVLVLHDNCAPAHLRHGFDIGDPSRLERLLDHLEKVLREGSVTPWGHTPEGRLHIEQLEKSGSEKRPDWSWDETRSVNIPEEFRHELAAGLDEHAE